MARTMRALQPARDALASSADDGPVHARIGELQRGRILAAMVEVAAQHGGGNVTVAHVIERSGVSRRTFYDQFSDLQDCFLIAFEDAIELAAERVLPAFQARTAWRERVRAGLAELLALFDEQPAIGRLLVVESPSGGARALERRGQTIAQITRAIEAGHGVGAEALPRSLVAEGTVGGVLTVIQARLAAEDRAPLLGLLNQLMAMIVLPYMGVAAARRELDRPLPAIPRQRLAEPEPLLSDPFKAAGMRLTYRTVRVLMAIAQRPGSSNRTIGHTAGIDDQGQISKLLSRVQRIGLVSNTGLGSVQGAPNAWSLTDRGRQVLSSIRGHTEVSQWSDGEQS